MPYPYMSMLTRFLITSLLFVTVSVAVAQKILNPNKALPSSDCGTPTPSKEAITAAEQAIFRLKQNGVKSIPPSTVNIPIKAHIIRRSDGTGGLDQTTLNTAIATMNTIYQPVNLQFYLCNGVHYIDNDNLYECDVDTDDTVLRLNNVNDALNIYFVGNLTATGGTLNGISAFPSGSASANRIIMGNYAVANGSTLSHEVGHFWNLYHTHETAVANELVTRGAGANCTTAGDLLCDTPADPCCYYYSSSTCTYTGTVVDANGAIYSPLINNLMSYYTTCRTNFTSGQYNRMGDGYTYRLSLMQQSGAYTYNCQQVAVAAPGTVQVATNTTTCARTITWADNSTTENGYIIERSLSLTVGFAAVGTVAANSISFVDTAPVPGVPLYYRVVAANSNALASAVITSASCGTIPPPTYCTPGTTDCASGDAITNVQLIGNVGTLINNTSGCGTNGYANFSGTVSATLTSGQNYTITVTNPGQYKEGFTVWIDYNQDKTFATNEIVFKSTTTTVQSVQRGTFVVSATALSGQTRMRIRQSDDTAGVPSLPCNSYAYGETEDYTIIIPGTITTAMRSLGSGSWGTPGTWSGNRVPAIGDDITISPAHTVTINGITGRAKNVKLNGKLTYQNNGKLAVGQ